MPARDILLKCMSAKSKIPWQLTNADENQRRELLTSSTTGRIIYGSERVNVDFIPYMTIPGIYKIIKENENPHVIVEVWNGKYISVSFGSGRGVADPSKLSYTINIYTKDPERAAAHAHRQIADAVQKYLDKMIMFTIYTDAAFKKGSQQRKVIEDAISELGLTFLPDKTSDDLHVINAQPINMYDSFPTVLLPKGLNLVSKL